MTTRNNTPTLLLVMMVSLTIPTPARPQAPSGDPIRFSDLTDRAGLVAPLAGLMGHGGAWGDYDGDGRIDLYVGGFCDRPAAEYAPAAGPVPNRLFRNLGDGRFAPVDQPALRLQARTSGAVFADLDNDGDLDLYVANNARRQSRRSAEPQHSAQSEHSRLFRNDGGTFVDVSAESGACPPALDSARNVGILDFDGDGRLDLLLIEDHFTRQPRSVLLRNRGGLRFEEANQAAHLPDDLSGLGLAVADLNNDGRPDFFVGHSNRMFLSRGDGTYAEPESLRRLFAWEPLGGEDWPCGPAFGDLDRDGDLDLVLTIHSVRARNRVYLNGGLEDGIPQFRDVTKAVGLGDSVPAKCPHVEIQDFDNDGLPDLYTSAAWRDRDGRVTPLIYRNLGTRDGLPRFAPPRPIAAPMVYYPAGPSGDYDGDGRLDLFLINWFNP
ncbi:MAG: VCBS repeat-containing protein [Isosphaeraceae bacterium]|nr:VCBS repeat-containing protein [Isosphaeraceae bacterium]